MNPYTNLLLTYVKPRWRQTVLLFLLLLTATGLQLYGPILLSQFLDAAIDGSSLQILFRLAALFLTIALATQVASLIETYVAENLGLTVTNQLRADIALHCLQLDLSFHNSHTPGELIERVDGDVTALSNFFSRFVVLLVGNALLVFGILLYLAQIDLWLAGMLAALTLVGLMFMVRIRDIAVPSITAVRQAMAELFGFLEERLAGIEDLHTNGATAFSVEQLRNHSHTLYQKALKAGVMVAVLMSSSRVFFTIVTAITLLLIVNLYSRQLITVGTAYLVYRYTEMLMRPVEEINRQMLDFQKAIASVVRVQELLETQSRIADTGQGRLARIDPQKSRTHGVRERPHSQEQGLLRRSDRTFLDKYSSGHPNGVKTEFAHVSFAYTPSNTVLHDISFSLEPGEVLGVLGHTGSGKTTLTRLLFRLYEPTAGTIRLDNERLDDLALRDLRRQIGLVTQDVQLFDATVRDNLTFFDQSIGDQEIVAILNEVGLARWLKTLPAGLDTKLDQHSMHLSAGEAQLLAFVRVFLTNPALIILDEASSRLDPITEHHIESALDRLFMHRTGIVIAHRLSTIERADTIMILDKGRVVEVGPRLALADSPTSKFAHLLQVGLTDPQAEVAI